MSIVPANNITHAVLVAIGQTFGTGFLIHSARTVYFATAKHVLFKKGLEPIDKEAKLTTLVSDLVSKSVVKIDLEAMLADGSLKKHPTSDVAVVKIATLEDATPPDKRMINWTHVQVEMRTPKGTTILGLPAERTEKFDDVAIAEEVIVFSYPTSLGITAQLDRYRPLLRRGIVAGKTEDRRIVIDCPTYFGNSGGLVVKLGLDDSIKGIGLVTEMVPFVEELWSRQFNVQAGIRFENSGYSLVEPIDRVAELF